ncbi:trypsin-like peptidase domain-containing protein [Clostridium botulinum D/C]|uniref:S1 family peptidase n=1 Tax=Clostridium botulinum TaxID=1491 RepID=UPI001E5355C6|nr:S1 family peptidase [Clostridium botulinum]MCD3350270.1 trypsin-like peptidase domain-containing protein [Clostridium botulinum D/C]MCD3359290.1 trypsin-like peptidase domain-containing protein [Clostridium botulinum D/C]MCD3362935.1 trypsin-like peptidase domain-containing protein [Clostridium botulinum D/C]MCD3365061.1 trypsin-like peptidase domain-containing protein [Clostridium botulinum D/C]
MDNNYYNKCNCICNCNLSCSLEQQIRYICENEYDFFLNKPNVQAVGLGFNVINGVCTFQKCIKVFLSKKIPENSLPQSALVPPIYKGIITDTTESGIFSSSQLTSRIRPVLEGYSIGPAAQNTAGTFGCLVKDLNDHSINLLSCNHVLARLGLVPIGAPILQPGLLDGGNIHTDVVATLSRFIPIKFKGLISSPTNLADAAIAKVSNPSLVSNKLAILKTPLRGVAEPSLGEHVFKIGRTTGSTEGFIVATDVSQLETYPKGKALFKHQIITSNPSDPGDSGAILFDEHFNALGLLFMTTDKKNFTSFNLISDVLKLLNVSLITSN